MLPITVMYYVYSGPGGMVGLNANSQGGLCYRLLLCTMCIVDQIEWLA